MMEYRHLMIERLGPVTEIVINRPDVLNAANHVLHGELGDVWLDLDKDPKTRAVVITGAGKAFSAGGDLEMVEGICGNYDKAADSLRQTADIVYNMIGFTKPIVSAINGLAIGAGLAVALLADISVIGESARLSDGHARLGVAAGDHAAIVWPLLCGMAKAKLYLLTADFVPGPEAERIGLVSRCVADDEVLPTALEYAQRLADGPQHAIRWTKKVLNDWMRLAGPIFDASVALEHLTLMGDDVQEGLLAIRERRQPRFPSATADVELTYEG
jgi:enoyl-CoA hydratase